jgi:hypothetical protein
MKRCFVIVGIDGKGIISFKAENENDGRNGTVLFSSESAAQIFVQTKRLENEWIAAEIGATQLRHFIDAGASQIGINGCFPDPLPDVDVFLWRFVPLAEMESLLAPESTC